MGRPRSCRAGYSPRHPFSTSSWRAGCAPANRDTCGYSVHSFSIGRRIKVKAGLDKVLVFREGTEVAQHLRCWARHLTITDPARSAANLRPDLRRHRGLPGKEEIA
ncbi:Mu transposase domain-containing protein [Streptomyces sp. KHY 26]|uniref:Mu transposase domain-containing protein n=1 Tax=Streptomyces sp. KHY 26 TaxID=3097359 RepID=UPI00376F45B4